MSKTNEVRLLILFFGVLGSIFYPVFVNSYRFEYYLLGLMFGCVFGIVLFFIWFFFKRLNEEELVKVEYGDIPLNEEIKSKVITEVVQDINCNNEKKEIKEQDKDNLLRKIIKSYKIDDFKSNIKLIQCLGNKGEWILEKKYISALYQKLDRNDYLIKSDITRFVSFFCEYFDIKFDKSIISNKNYKIAESVYDDCSVRTEVEKFYVDELSVFGDK